MQASRVGENLTPRQQRELDYHREHAAKRNALAREPVNLDVVEEPRRRWWNAYWVLYTIVRRLPIAGMRVLVPGCGFGEDAIRLAVLGAEVHTFDLSPDVIEIARQRAKRFPGLRLHFDTMPAEVLNYPSDFFDLVFLVDILHHVDIRAAMGEIVRVLKPGGTIVGDELYTHSLLQGVRESAFVTRVLYPRMQRYIYGTDKPYITADEHKIDEMEFAIVRTCLLHRGYVRYFNFLVGRIIPSRSQWVTKLDRMLIAMTGSLGRFLAGRVVFIGTVGKDSPRP